MKIGFTGTQHGMTVLQKESLVVVLEELLSTKLGSNEPFEFHHGDCIGADAEAHNIIVAGGGGLFKIIIHPPSNPLKRAWCKSEEVRRHRPYLVRNKDIVNESDIIIAAPRTNLEESRSGTWATMRYARFSKKKTMILFPNGVIKREEGMRHGGIV